MVFPVLIGIHHHVIGTVKYLDIHVEVSFMFRKFAFRPELNNFNSIVKLMGEDFQCVFIDEVVRIQRKNISPIGFKNCVVSTPKAAKVLFISYKFDLWLI